MSPLTWQADTCPQSTFVAVHGTPDAPSMLALHAMLKRHLARRPNCLILDLPDMSALDRAVVTGSSLTKDYGTMVSSTTTLLCADPAIDVTVPHQQPARAAALARRFARVREALTLGPLRSPSFIEQILPLSGSTRRTRDIVTHACQAWSLTHLSGSATLPDGHDTVTWAAMPVDVAAAR